MGLPAKNRVAVLLIGAVAACATASPSGDEGGGPAKYPRRRPGCKLAVFHTPSPGVPAWDDIGVAEVGCQLDVGVQQCMQRLKEEACRLGGDIIYNVPEKPLRPKDQVLVYRAQVAHTRVSDKKTDDTPPPEQDAGPIEPLMLRPPAAADGGTSG